MEGASRRQPAFDNNWLSMHVDFKGESGISRARPLPGGAVLAYLLGDAQKRGER
jgi:hypothetical protein